MNPIFLSGTAIGRLASLSIFVICATGGAQTTSPATGPTTGTTTTAPATGPSTQPITTAKSPVGDLLRKWWAEGTAAGNVGDIYDNRDRTHSELNRGPYPQLVKFQYTKEQLDMRRDWAAQHTLIRGIVFGNSSTSAPITQGGSNPRMYYSNPRGVAFLFNQYLASNLYIYPEHQDHDPGHNGLPSGYGDVYPTNTPYLLISQGSSGSDQPFMRAVPFTLAAFRPEVKQALAKRGMLMGTIQMILRSSMKNIKTPEEYLTGKAHPTVFEGANVDDLKMVRMAHDITLDTLPPMVVIKVEKEDRFENGRDFFEPTGYSEQFVDTPCVAARIWRASAGKRRIVVAAAVNAESSKLPLKYHWSILRGDEKHIAIKPLDEQKSKVEITIEYQERMPISAGSAMESNRIDIGAFVYNGAYWSPPAFVTFWGLDSEARAYDEAGRILEIGYGAGEAQYAVADWIAMFDALAAEKPTPGVELLKKQFSAGELDAIGKIGQSFKAKTVTKDPKVRELVDNKQPNLPGSLKSLMHERLMKASQGLAFVEEHGVLLTNLLEKAEAGKKNAVKAARTRLGKLGMAKEGDGIKLELTPVVAGDAPAAQRLTRFELGQTQRYHAELVANLLLPGLVRADYKTNYVDPNLSKPKNWRDIYRYDKEGKLAGWTRLGLEKTYEFAPDGRVILEKDADGNPAKSAGVRYEQDAPRAPQRGPNWNALKQVVEEK